MKVDATLGSEVNPEGTDEYQSDFTMPDLDDISGAGDPFTMPDVETPAHLDGIVHDGDVIDPVD